MTTTVQPRWMDPADRLYTLLVLGVMLADVALLAFVELMFVTLRVGGGPLPVSSLVALVSTPWLVRRTGDLPTGTLGAMLVLSIWVALVSVLGFTGPGGDVLLPEDWPSMVFLAAGLFPGALALGRVIRAHRAVR